MSKDYKNEKALIICHPDMKKHLAEHSKDQMLPDEMFVLSILIDPDYAFVVSAEEFAEWINTHNHGKWKIRKEAE